MDAQALIKKIEGMKNLGGHPRFYELLLQAAEIHARKNKNYAVDGNPLSNLKECERIGIRPFIGVMIRLFDKWSRLIELTKGKQDLVGESLVDTLLDNAIYSVLAIILLEEEQKSQ